jgi:hypothetical protein
MLRLDRGIYSVALGLSGDGMDFRVKPGNDDGAVRDSQFDHGTPAGQGKPLR